MLCQPVGITLSPLLAAAVMAHLNTAAFQGEILRAGFKMLLQRATGGGTRFWFFSSANAVLYSDAAGVARHDAGFD
jgi:polar amino acid transport system permease protein